ncbi:MAG: hydroxymethylbilane synthase [Phycisphaeraceae bacterium]
MRRSKKPIVIASRTSALARVQAEMVGRGLARLNPGIEVRYVWVESEGDQVKDGPLSAVGGKGLFTKAVERIVLAGDADIAVHSMKDMPADPAEVTPGLQIAAVPKRADVRDVLIGRAGAVAIDALPRGASVGTSSPRRAAQLKRLRPDLSTSTIRGNVDTRLAKVLGEPRVFDATLLAFAGLSRLGRVEHLNQPLAVEQVLPAASQGALGIQCRRDDHISLTRLLPLNDPATATAIHAEREVVAGLGADCHSPIAVLAEQVDPEKTRATRNADSHWFRLRVRVLSIDGTQMIDADEQCKTQELRRLVKRVVEDLTERGAKQLLSAAKR